MSRWHNFDHPDLPERAFQSRGWKGGMTLEGGSGGGSAPAPDPQIAASQKRLADIADQVWSNFRDNISPGMTARINQQNGVADTAAQTSFDTANTALQRGNDAYSMAVSTAMPALKALQTDANNYNEAGYQEQLASQAGADVNNAFDQQRRAQAMRSQAYGVDPTSGVAQGGDRALSVQQALANSQATNQVRQAAHEAGIAKQANLYNAGVGLSNVANAQTSLGMSGVAQGVNIGQMPVANYATLAGAATGSANSAMGGLSSAGNLGLGSYQAQISAYNAQQQANATSSAGWGSALGSGIGAFSALYKAAPVVSNIAAFASDAAPAAAAAVP